MKTTSTFEKGGAKSYPLLRKVEPNNPPFGKVEPNIFGKGCNEVRAK